MTPNTTLDRRLNVIAQQHMMDEIARLQRQVRRLEIEETILIFGVVGVVVAAALGDLRREQHHDPCHDRLRGSHRGVLRRRLHPASEATDA